MHVFSTRPGLACSSAFEVLGTIPADVHTTYSTGEVLYLRICKSNLRLYLYSTSTREYHILFSTEYRITSTVGHAPIPVDPSACHVSNIDGDSRVACSRYPSFILVSSPAVANAKWSLTATLPPLAGTLGNPRVKWRGRAFIEDLVIRNDLRACLSLIFNNMSFMTTTVKRVSLFSREAARSPPLRSIVSPRERGEEERTTTSFFEEDKPVVVVRHLCVCPLTMLYTGHPGIPSPLRA